MGAIIGGALAVAGGAFAPVYLAFGWVHRAAHILGQDGLSGARVRNQLAGLLGAMRRHRAVVGELGAAVDQFLKVGRSYWPGLFRCYDTAGLPRTNNDPERAFGSHRYHERRSTGRKGASPALVLRGSARLVAGLATRSREVTATDLAGADRGAWQRLRAELERRRQRRVERRQFRRDPHGYLKALEDKLNQSRLPTWFFFVQPPSQRLQAAHTDNVSGTPTTVARATTQTSGPADGGGRRVRVMPVPSDRGTAP